MRLHWTLLALAVTGAAACVLPADRLVAEEICKRDDFEGVVAGAAKALRDLNQRNKPAFQARLRELRDKRGWSPDDLMTQGAAYVQDAQITEFDDRSNGVLESIQRIGAEGQASQTPSCKALGEMRGLMTSLVAIQNEKWAYMFGKIEKELAR